MQIREVLDTLESGVEFIEKIAPLAGMLGGYVPASAAQALWGVTTIIASVRRLTDEGVIVASSDNLAGIEALRLRLRDANDALAAIIVKS